jgi:hypothetical protein
VEGASALGKLLAKYPDANARVLVIWEPVIRTDLGPPTSAVRGPLADPRVIEYWDKHRSLSPRMIQRAAMMAKEQGTDPPLGPDEIAWDLIAIFPPESAWADPFPVPSWYDGPVVRSLGPVEESLKQLTPLPTP